MTKIDFINELKSAINIAQFEIVFAKYGNDISAIYDSLTRSGLDKQTKGFWIWDIENNIELYSDKFIAALGFKRDEVNNDPSFWQGLIFKADLKVAAYNFELHVISKAKEQYIQTVKYQTKKGGVLKVLCHGKIMSWVDEEKTQPKLMIGVHL